MRASGTNGGKSDVIDHIPPTIEVEKPWGRFEQYTHNALSTVKVITVEPGGALSLQYHHRRDELWVVLDDADARIELGEEVIQPQEGEKIFIPRETAHRLTATGDRTVRILEVSTGEFDEDDIVRLEDVYGRVLVEGEARG
jgi:mannose-1-phosphate guanylyltransferase/mannose-6-phosphate isomerase